MATQDTSAAKSGFERRRSQRIMLRVPVRLYGNVNDQPVYHETQTETVSAHGALINVDLILPLNTKLILTNLITEEDMACKVVFQGATKEGQNQIAVEFLEASPRFWRVNFPPPGEKPLKRFGGPS
jgi:hypothetical protein